MCWSPWSLKESDTTERLNNKDLKWLRRGEKGGVGGHVSLHTEGFLPSGKYTKMNSLWWSFLGILMWSSRLLLSWKMCLVFPAWSTGTLFLIPGYLSVSIQSLSAEISALSPVELESPWTLHLAWLTTGYRKYLWILFPIKLNNIWAVISPLHLGFPTQTVCKPFTCSQDFLDKS